jgi:phosphoglycerol transferase MdoB-like AlkP superfamily enzyme
MKKRISLFLLYFAFWYVLFIIARIAFLISYFGKTVKLPVTEIFSTFIYGFKLDVGIVAYIVFLPTLLLSLTTFFKANFIKYFYHFYTLLVLFLCSAIILGDLFMYQHWGFRLDATPLFYMSNLNAMTASVSTLIVIGGVLGVVILTAILYLFYLNFFRPVLNSLKKDKKAFYVLFPVGLLLIIVMRGGIGISSLTTSSAYFSKNQFANHAAINPVWNVGFSITESNDLNRKYEYFTDAEVNKILLPLHQQGGSKINLLNTDRPNIILFITESLTAKALAATGGRADIMPNLNQLVKEGILFNHIYAASDRTDKGIAAVLSGYPSLPGSSPLKYQKLTQKLAFVPQKLNAIGYKSELYYGGTLDFANYRSFVVQAGYDKMVSDIDFPPSDLKSKWGAFDDVVFSRCLADTPDGDKKFFKTIITLTSHEPFETPVPPVFPGDDTETKYLNSLHYTDQSIGDFIKVAKTRDWWKNTLVIIIADHGSRMPGNSENYEESKYHIPMIWLGDALRVKDTVVQNLASQTDLAATLLSQLNIQSDEFKFSKNILKSSYLPYAFFTFADGFGFYKPDNLLIYNTVTNTYMDSASGKDSISEKQGKAYLQSLYIDFYTKNK